jgi:hypothetical protein
MRMKRIVPLCLALLFMVSAGLAENRENRMLVLINGFIRKDPAPRSMAIRKITGGDTLFFSETKNGWYHVVNPAGQPEGWVAESDVKVVSTAAGPKARTAEQAGSGPDKMVPLVTLHTYIRPGKLMATTNTPLYEVPSVNGAFSMGVSYRDILRYLDEKDEYFKVVNDKRGSLGWIPHSLTRVIQKPETLVFLADDERAAAITDSLDKTDVLDSLGQIYEGSAAPNVFAQPEEGLNTKIGAFLQVNKKLLLYGSSIVSGGVLLALLLSKTVSDNGGGASAQPSPGGGNSGPPADGDIPPIDVPTPR